MAFIADKQTLEDLNLLGKFKPQSIYNLFNKVRTGGGERLLDSMFRQPLSDAAAINKRSRVFRYFQEQALVFPCTAATFKLAEAYLGYTANSSFISALAGITRRKLTAVLLRDEQFNNTYYGLLASMETLAQLHRFCDGKQVAPQMQAMSDILADPRLAWAIKGVGDGKISFFNIARYDHLLRHTLRDKMERLLELVYEIDVYIAVSDVARARNFSYAQAMPADSSIAECTGLRHPALEKGVPNDVSLNAAGNLLFLTGANMAGKSTLMKSYGIAIYLAHMGFPVAAGKMVFSVRDGLYSSINTPDNLHLGYSHFYAEVLRVKTVAEAVSQGKRLVIIFDELFKGTNVKDAYDATLAVTSAFAEYRGCVFIISTHIIEVGAALQNGAGNIHFAYLPTIMEGNVPKYPYTLTPGITSDRHGMMIIQNEKILDILAG